MIHYKQILLRLPLASVLGLLFIIDWSHSCFINREFDHRLLWLLHDDLHWLDVPERIQYKAGVTVHRCLQSKVPKYLTNCCTPVSETASRRHLHSASQSTSPVSTTSPAHYHRPSSLLCCRSGTLYQTDSDTRLSAAASGNYSRRTCSTVTQHTQRSRDAAWLCAV